MQVPSYLTPKVLRGEPTSKPMKEHILTANDECGDKLRALLANVVDSNPKYGICTH